MVCGVKYSTYSHLCQKSENQALTLAQSEQSTIPKWGGFSPRRNKLAFDCVYDTNRRCDGVSLGKLVALVTLTKKLPLLKWRVVHCSHYSFFFFLNILVFFCTNSAQSIIVVHFFYIAFLAVHNCIILLQIISSIVIDYIYTVDCFVDNITKPVDSSYSINQSKKFSFCVYYCSRKCFGVPYMYQINSLALRFPFLSAIFHKKEVLSWLPHA